VFFLKRPPDETGVVSSVVQASIRMRLEWGCPQLTLNPNPKPTLALAQAMMRGAEVWRCMGQALAEAKFLQQPIGMELRSTTSAGVKSASPLRLELQNRFAFRTLGCSAQAIPTALRVTLRWRLHSDAERASTLARGELPLPTTGLLPGEAIARDWDELFPPVSELIRNLSVAGELWLLVEAVLTHDEPWVRAR